MSPVLDLDRAGFWRRLIAYAVDVAVAALLFHLLVALAFTATGGAVFSTSGVHRSICRPETAMPAGGRAVTDLAFRVPGSSPPPRSPVPDRISRCDVTFFGLAAGRFVAATSLARTGREVETKLRVLALDPEGRPRAATSLDVWLYPFFVWLRALTDGLDGSLGRRLVRIRLVDGRDADDRAPAPPSLPRLVARYALFALPAVPALLWMPDLVRMTLVPTTGVILGLVGQTLLVSLPGLIATAGAALAVARDRDAFYDRPGATQVRRLGR